MTTTSPWVNTGPDEAAPDALLRRLAARLPVSAIDQLWIFPTRRAAGVESTVIVVASFHEDADKRRVHTAHFRATRDRRGNAKVDEQIVEHAFAAEPAIERAVEGVLKRLGDAATGVPRTVTIRGDSERWRRLLEELAPAHDIDPLG